MPQPALFRLPKPAFGTLAPVFHAAVLDGNPRYAFNTVAGRPVLLFLMGSAAQPALREAHAALAEDPLFDDERACFFGISIDPADAARGRIVTRIPGRRYVLDHDRAVSRLYGAADEKSGMYEPYLITLDRRLRVTGKYAPRDWRFAMEEMRRLAEEAAHTQEWAPVLVAPRILEHELCTALIEYCERTGSEPSGFMVEEEGRTVLRQKAQHKLRRDCLIEEPALCEAIAGRINQRLRPLIRQAFNFDATRIERYIVACYDSGEGGHFRPHRDNTTRGTAHRRFAVSINLNSDFDGADLRFPEFGTRTYRPPPGGAVVFSCNLLHEATPVTRGRRYATLTFLYDDAAARLREANQRFIDESVGEAGTRAD